MKQFFERLGLKNPITTLAGLVILCIGAYQHIRLHQPITAESVAFFTLGLGLIGARDGNL